MTNNQEAAQSWTASVARCGSFLDLEEGCHSAGFNATIHLRHHLLLSIGWRFMYDPLNDVCSMAQFNLDVNSPDFILTKL